MPASPSRRQAVARAYEARAQAMYRAENSPAARHVRTRTAVKLAKVNPPRTKVRY